MKYCFFKINSLLVFCLIFLSVQNVNSQSLSASPYSRYAFGDINDNPHSSFFGLSGTSISLCDSFQFNSYNPASYSFILKHRPVFDIGIGGQYLQMKTTTDQENAIAINLRAISIGIPISKRWGMGFGITPLSTIGYNFVNKVNDPVIGDISYKFDGKGGVNRLFMGTSFEIVSTSANKLSVGVNGAYLFGSLNTASRAIIDGGSASTGVLHSKVVNNTFISDFITEGGVLYRGKINETSFLNFGANLNFSSRLYAKRESLAYTFSNTITEELVDTVEYKSSAVGRIYYPKKTGFAFSYEKLFPRHEQGASKRMIFTLQYEMQDWDKYSEVFDDDTVMDGLKNTRYYNFGIQYTPFSSNIIGPEQKWWEISTYRFAVRTGTTYLQLNDTQLNQYGISFGMGIPLLNSMSFSQVNFGVEAGRRGTLESGLIEESYININIGLTISPSRSDPWFIKRKYD